MRIKAAKLRKIRDAIGPLYKDKMPEFAYHIAYESGTERPFRNQFWNNHKQGLYRSVASGEILFSSKDKYESGTGWPSFSRPAQLMNG